MPTIQQIDTVAYDLPLRRPLRWGAGHEMPALEHLLVRVTLDDGAVGLAEVNPRPTIYGETPASASAIIRDYIAPRLRGQQISDADDIARAGQRYALLKNNNSARAGVDIALWDALAASQGVSLLSLLGGAKQSRVRVSYILGTGPTDDVLASFERVYAAGVRVVKVKVTGDFDAEADLIRRLTETYPDVNTYLDANETFTADTALALLQGYSSLGAWYCEEPLPVHQIEQRAELRGASPIMIIGDDSCFTLRDVERELAFNTFDVLNIKPPRTGFTTSLAMLRLVRRAEKYVMTGSQASSILGCLHTLMLATHLGVTEPSEGTYWLQVDSADALPLVDGYVTLDALEVTYAEVRARLLAAYFGG